MADAIKRLPEREKIVIGLYYYEGLTLKEIGEVLGVTESRISQLHTKAILRLKGRIKQELEPGLLWLVASASRRGRVELGRPHRPSGPPRRTLPASCATLRRFVP